MSAIVAAASPDSRQELKHRAVAAGMLVRAEAPTAQILALQLAERKADTVLTTGAAQSLRSFVATAVSAGVPVLVIGALSGELAWEEFPGPLAVVAASASSQVLRAAAGAVASGLRVFQPLPTPRASGPGGDSGRSLSPRERQILTRVAAGLASKVIARQLGVSINTIKFHLQEAFAKLGVATRAEAVVAAIRRGEISL